MARFHFEGIGADASQVSIWDQIEENFEGANDEGRAARMLYRFTGGVPALHDTNGRQKAVDILLALPSGELAVIEVSSTFDEVFQRDLNNSFRLESDIGALYSGTAHWVLHLHAGWDVPAQKARRTLAAEIADELQRRKSDHKSGYLDAAAWLFAWRDDDVPQPGVEVRGWDSRVTRQNSPRVLDQLTAFLDGPSIRGKRNKLSADAQSLDAGAQWLYLITTPSGANALLGSASIWELAEGGFTLPPDLDELWLDNRGGALRRFSRALGTWTEYSI